MKAKPALINAITLQTAAAFENIPFAPHEGEISEKRNVCGVNKRNQHIEFYLINPYQPTPITKS